MAFAANNLPAGVRVTMSGLFEFDDRSLRREVTDKPPENTYNSAKSGEGVDVREEGKEAGE